VPTEHTKDGTALPAIRTTCPHCGPLSLAGDGINVRVCANDRRASYWFCCPECGTRVAFALSRRKLELLIEFGFAFDVWTMPAEVDERPDGPPLTLDDVLDFHLLLTRSDWLEQLSRVGRGPTSDSR
jgi:hypothetical protein